MSQTTLGFSVVASALTALLYLYVGSVIRKRVVSAEAKLAQSMFVLWWQALGYLSLLGAAALGLYMAGGLDDTRIWLYQSYVSFVLLVLFVALWGLQFYLVYLYTGSKRWFAPLGVFYAVLFMATLALVSYAGTPQHIVDNGWFIKTEPELKLGPAVGLGFVLVLVGPQVLAAIAYARLFRKTDDRTQKYRIAMVTGSILVWFGSSILATAAQVSTAGWWQIISRFISVFGALAILMAYKPPAWIRKHGIRSISEETGGASPA